jgi:polyhydroxybutyrate depolymerase
VCRFQIIQVEEFSMRAPSVQRTLLAVTVAVTALMASTSYAGPLRALFGNRNSNGSGSTASASDNAATPPGVVTQSYDGRDMLIFAPSQLPPKGGRALVVVLHGGLSSAAHVEGGDSEKSLSMDSVAGQNGFVVAYLNGTIASPRFSDRLAWNAGGGCCGQAYKNNVDDVGYISSAVKWLVGEYGIDPHRVYVMGHSNGAMMAQRMMCESSVFTSAVAISGTLLTQTSGSCPAARGKHILSIHGADDTNVPIKGGYGSGVAGVAYNSEASTQQVYANSAADYQLQIVPGADHKMDNLDSAIRQSEGISISEKAARYFGLAGSTH